MFTTVKRTYIQTTPQLTPTPSVTPTITPTPNYSATPTPTPTISVTPTITPSYTPNPDVATFVMNRSNPGNRPDSQIQTTPVYGSTTKVVFGAYGSPGSPDLYVMAKCNVSTTSLYFSNWTLDSTNMSWTVPKIPFTGYYGPTDKNTWFYIRNHDKSTKQVTCVFVP